jgi:hypothetical protein
MDSSDYEGADHGTADADARVRFQTHSLAPDCRRLSSQRSGSSRLQAVAILLGANFDKMLEADPDSCAQASKEAAA